MSIYANLEKAERLLAGSEGDVYEKISNFKPKELRGTYKGVDVAIGLEYKYTDRKGLDIDQGFKIKSFKVKSRDKGIDEEELLRRVVKAIQSKESKGAIAYEVSKNLGIKDYLNVYFSDSFIGTDLPIEEKDFRVEDYLKGVSLKDSDLRHKYYLFLGYYRS